MLYETLTIMEQISFERPLLSSHVQPETFAPKYVDLARRLLRDIAAKGLKPGDRFGTETELIAEHRLSRATVRQALSILERDGYVSRHRARGTFIGREVGSVAECDVARGTALIVCSNEQTCHVQDDFAFAQVLRLAERALSREGFAVQFLSVGGDADEDRARLRRLVNQGRINGICTIGDCFEPFRGLVPNIPIVSSCSFNPLPAPWVGADVQAAAYASVKYLLDRGHREIAMVCRQAVDSKAFSTFVAGYREAFASASVAVNRQLLCHAYEGEALEQLFVDLLKSSRPPTAIFCENWQVCQAALAAANNLGVRTPEDLSLVGYGHNAVHLAAPVKITSYVPDAENIAQQIARLLGVLTQGNNVSGEPIFLKGKLVEGQSVRTLGTASEQARSDAS